MKKYKIIEKYNNWVNKQIAIFSRNNIDCPYYIITQKTIKSLSKEQVLLLDKFESSGYSNNIEFKIWNQIFSRITYIPKIKNTKPKELKGIALKKELNNKKSLLDYDFFVMHLQKQGFNIIKYHFKWLIKNEIIKPYHSTKKETFFNYYQLLEYDTVEKYKEKSLDYPNPKILELEKTYITGTTATTWQEYLLLNKEIIKKYNKKYEKIIELLYLLNILDKQIFDKIIMIKERDKEGKLNKANLEHIFSDLRYKTYKYYSKNIIRKTKVSQAYLEYWIYSLFPTKVIAYNPLWQVSHEMPAIEKLFIEDEKYGYSIFNKKNNIRIANFYIEIIKKLSEFLRASFNQDLIGIPELLSKTSFNKDLICPICTENFYPNKKRRGGREQILCGNPLCDKEWRRIRANKNRIKNKK